MVGVSQDVVTADTNPICRQERQPMSSFQSPEPGRTAADEDLSDLFEEAPVAYVHEDLNTRFIRANRAAREILGISAEEVNRTLGISLVVDSQEAAQSPPQTVSAKPRG